MLNSTRTVLAFCGLIFFSIFFATLVKNTSSSNRPPSQISQNHARKTLDNYVQAGVLDKLAANSIYQSLVSISSEYIPTVIPQIVPLKTLTVNVTIDGKQCTILGNATDTQVEDFCAQHNLSAANCASVKLARQQNIPTKTSVPREGVSSTGDTSTRDPIKPFATPPNISIIIGGLEFLLRSNASDVQVARFCYLHEINTDDCISLAQSRSVFQDEQDIENGWKLQLNIVNGDGSITSSRSSSSSKSVRNSANRNSANIPVFEFGRRLRVTTPNNYLVPPTSSHSSPPRRGCISKQLLDDIQVWTTCHELPFYIDLDFAEEQSHMITFVLEHENDAQAHEKEHVDAALFFQILPPNPNSNVLSTAQKLNATRKGMASLLWYYCSSSSVVYTQEQKHYACDMDMLVQLGRPNTGLMASPKDILVHSMSRETDIDAALADNQVGATWCNIFVDRHLSPSNINVPKKKMVYFNGDSSIPSQLLFAQKLEHDAEQFQYISQQHHYHSSTFDQLALDYANLANMFQNDIVKSGPLDCSEIGTYMKQHLDIHSHRRIALSYSRILFQPPSFVGNPTVGKRFACTLSPTVDASIHMQNKMDYNAARAVVVDNLLTPDTLQQLRDVLLSSTSYIDVRPGFVGAYFEHDLAHPLLIKIAADIGERYRNIICGRPIKQIWSFKYDSTWHRNIKSTSSSGTSLHADSAAVNVNIWITADEANLDEASGGLVLYEGTKAPYDMSFESYNTEPNKVRAWLKNAPNTVRRVVAYKANRMVMFDSQLFHETDKIRFKKGYRNRRINLTFLYGYNLRGQQNGGDCKSKMYHHN